MKLTCRLLLIVFILAVKVSLGQKETNSALDKIISIEVSHETIAAVLDKISSLTQVYFSYDPSVIQADKKIDASFTDKTIKEILDVLFESKFFYHVIDKQIIITTTDFGTEKNKPINSNVKPKMITFRGKVIDQDQKKALPFTSISIHDRNIRTISNIDGDFEMKIPYEMINDTAVVSCLGYKQSHFPIRQINDERVIISLETAIFHLQEINVTSINSEEIIARILTKIAFNYPLKPEIMTSFYREVLKQDKNYIDVAEAVIELRKAPYDNSATEDKVKFIKGRKSLNVKPFELVDFKLQGGPYYITRLDVIKTLDSFLDPQLAQFYKYSLDEIVEFDNRSTYVLQFKPKEKVEDAIYQGTLWVDMSSFALVQAEFELSHLGLKLAQGTLIKKKPSDVFVRPLHVTYQVNYRRSEGVWHLSNAQASLRFRVKSKKGKINSVFHSTCELLVTDFKSDDGTHFKRNEIFSSKDIFSQMINNYDKDFWHDYNIIKPSEDLQKALNKYYLQNDTLFNSKENEKHLN